MAIATRMPERSPSAPTTAIMTSNDGAENIVLQIEQHGVYAEQTCPARR